MVSEEADAVKCDFWNLWFHAKCQRISSKRYKVIIDLSRMDTDDIDPNIHWLCNTCNSYAVSTIKPVQNLRCNQEQMKLTLATTCKSLDATEDDLKKLQQGSHNATDCKDKIAEKVNEEIPESKDKVRNI